MYYFKNVLVVVVGSIFFVGGILFVGVHMSLRPANAALQVSDFNSEIQHGIAAVHAATSVVQSATQIANEVKHLTGMSPDALVAHYLGLDETLQNVIDAYSAYNGLLASGKNASSAFDSAFGQVGTLFEGGTSLADYTSQKNSLAMLEKMNQDAIYLSKQAQKDIDKSQNNMGRSLTELGASVGNKQAVQALATIRIEESKNQFVNVNQRALQMAIEAGNNQHKIAEIAKDLGLKKGVLDDFVAFNAAHTTASGGDSLYKVVWPSFVVGRN